MADHDEPPTLKDAERKAVGDHIEALWKQGHTNSGQCLGCLAYGKGRHAAGLAATVVVGRFLAAGGRRSLLSCLVSP